MHRKHIVLLALIPFTSTAPLSNPPLPNRQTCTLSPIILTSIYYLEYLTYPYLPSPSPNSTQLAFTLSYPDPDITTGCAAQRVQSHGVWGDDSDYWYACTDRYPRSINTTLEAKSKNKTNKKTSIATKADTDPIPQTHVKVSWDTWTLTLNQTWQCELGIYETQLSTLALSPTCTETQSSAQYIKECTAPDIQFTPIR
ncbi:hypothetical protein GGR57DRAFT_501867 [Xylariaceae sp. FL1272]|nr:hypothetical protein GGR57DRAFT_501867 [Xylariaceae sp. FL1272]